jgi:hypothetical protein
MPSRCVDLTASFKKKRMLTLVCGVDPANDRLQAKFHFSHFGRLRSGVYFRPAVLLAGLAIQVGCSDRGLALPAGVFAPLHDLAGPLDLPFIPPPPPPPDMSLPTPPPIVSGVKRVFVTSEAYSVIDEKSGDAACQRLADAANLGGIYKAWLSEGADGPKQRFNHSVDGYVRVDGVVVANSWVDFTATGKLRHAISRDERGQEPPRLSPAPYCGYTDGLITNVNIDGSSWSADCPLLPLFACGRPWAAWTANSLQILCVTPDGGEQGRIDCFEQ